jgi:hypothetical protein
MDEIIEPDPVMGELLTFGSNAVSDAMVREFPQSIRDLIEADVVALGFTLDQVTDVEYSGGRIFKVTVIV